MMKVVGQTVQLWERKQTDGQTDGRTDATKFFISLASRSIITVIANACYVLLLIL